MKFNEDSRVKISTILHLMRLGYKYLALKDPSVTWDESTNIFTDIFLSSIKKINPSITDIEANQCFDDVSLCLGNEYYERITN
jgi:type I restriction enzyme R subunit